MCGIHDSAVGVVRRLLARHTRKSDIFPTGAKI